MQVIWDPLLYDILGQQKDILKRKTKRKEIRERNKEQIRVSSVQRLLSRFNQEWDY